MTNWPRNFVTAKSMRTTINVEREQSIRNRYAYNTNRFPESMM